MGHCLLPPDSACYPMAPLGQNSAQTSKDDAAAMRREISADFVAPTAQIKPADLVAHESDQTTHFLIIDNEGKVVSDTQWS